MKVTYIYHSGFAVELDNCILLFDYYKGELPRWEKNKMIYVFASHKHQDRPVKVFLYFPIYLYSSHICMGKTLSVFVCFRK